MQQAWMQSRKKQFWTVSDTVECRQLLLNPPKTHLQILIKMRHNWKTWLNNFIQMTVWLRASMLKLIMKLPLALSTTFESSENWKQELGENCGVKWPSIEEGWCWRWGWECWWRKWWRASCKYNHHIHWSNQTWQWHADFFQSRGEEELADSMITFIRMCNMQSLNIHDRHHFLITLLCNPVCWVGVTCNSYSAVFSFLQRIDCILPH